MKLPLFVISLALIAHANGLAELLVLPSEPPHAATALALECSDLAPDLRAECELEYQEAFRSGEIEPIAVLRMHCTRWSNPWESAPGEPPSLCTEQFGGWVVPESS